MKEISLRWGDAPKFKPKPNGLSFKKLFFAVFLMVRDNAFINAAIDKWTVLFEIEIKLFK